MGIRIHVVLHTILQLDTPGGSLSRLDVELADQSTIEDLLARLEIHHEPGELLLVANGRTATPEQTLSSGDEVHLIPAISGGSFPLR